MRLLQEQHRVKQEQQAAHLLELLQQASSIISIFTAEGGSLLVLNVSIIHNMLSCLMFGGSPQHVRFLCQPLMFGGSPQHVRFRSQPLMFGGSPRFGSG